MKRFTHHRAALSAAALLTTALALGGCDKASGKYVPDSKNESSTFFFKSDKLDITQKVFGEEVTIEYAYETDGNHIILHGVPDVPGAISSGNLVLTVQDSGDITGFPGVKKLQKVKE